MDEVLYTERLCIRKYQKGDIEDFYEVMKEEEVNMFLPWFIPKTMDEAEGMLTKYLNQTNGYYYAICLKEDQKMIGYVHVSGDESHDFGYGLQYMYWHKGIVSEACIAVIEKLRQDGMAYITATHDRKNERSGNVMKRLGMQYQYTYEEQWLPKDILVTFRMYQLNLIENQPIYMHYWNHYSVHYVEEL